MMYVVIWLALALFGCGVLALVNIAVMLRNIDRTLSVWVVRNLMPKLFDDFMKANMEEGENDNR